MNKTLQEKLLIVLRIIRVIKIESSRKRNEFLIRIFYSKLKKLVIEWLLYVCQMKN